MTILMDDGPGAAIATSEISRLGRLGSSGSPVGSITLASTLTILGRAAGTEHLPDRAAMRDTIPGYADSMTACRRLRTLNCWRPSSGHERPPAARERWE